jgi:hypothetical protein
MAKKILRIILATSTQSHKKDKRAHEPMENFNMGMKMEIKVLTRCNTQLFPPACN